MRAHYRQSKGCDKRRGRHKVRPFAHPGQRRPCRAQPRTHRAAL